MKKHLLCAFIALAGVAMPTTAQLTSSPWKGNAPANGVYYLYNVETGKWLQWNDWNLDYWNTRAELGDVGLDFTLKYDEANGGYILNPRMSGANSLREDFWLDTGDKRYWTFEEGELDGFTNTYMIYSGSCIMGVLNNKVDGSAEADCLDWQLVSKEDRIAALADASETNPLDATFLISGWDFTANDERRNDWKRENANDFNPANGSGSAEGQVKCNSVYESWHLTNAKIYQDVVCPNGTYKVTMNGIYSPTGDNNINSDNLNEYKAKGEETVKGYFFAGDKRVKLPSIYSNPQNTKVAGYSKEIVGEGVYVPANTRDMSYDFYAGEYNAGELTVNVTDGVLRIGVEVVDGTGESWVLFDKFRMTYLGNSIDLSTYTEALKATIAEGEAYTDKTSPVAKTALDNAIADGKAKVTSTDKEVLSAASKAIKDALQTAKDIAEPYNNLTATIELMKAEGATTNYAEKVASYENTAATSTSTDELNNALNDARVIRKMVHRVTYDNVWTGNTPEAGKSYYLYNVGAKGFLNGGNDWTTHMSIQSPGILVTLEAADDGGFKINSNHSNGGSNTYCSDNGYIDAGPFSWTFKSVGAGAYNIVRTNDTEVMLGYNETRMPGNIYQVDSDMKDGSLAANQWILVTEEERDALLAEATEENPVDATYKMKGSRFYNHEEDAWTYNGCNRLNVDGNKERVVEHWSNPSNDESTRYAMDLNTTVTGLPNGWYRVTTQALYRSNGDHDEHAQAMLKGETPEPRAIMYANDEETTLPIITDELNKVPGICTNSVYGAFPKWTDECSQCFQVGLYKKYVDVEVTDGELVIGISKDEGVDRDWVVVDNFTLTYYGADKPTAVNGVAAETTAKMVNVYSVDGVLVKKNVPAAQALDGLQKGVYVVDGNKVVK